jgi:sugar phosphate isomerase/epimerase
MITRRSLLASPLAAARLFGRARMDPSRVSAITDEIATSSQEAVEFARQYGLKWLELRSVPTPKRNGKEYIYLDEADLRQEAKVLADGGVRVSFLNSSLLKVLIPGIEPARWGQMKPEDRERRIKADTARFERRMEDLGKAIRAARILGVEKLRVFTGWRGSDPMAVLPKIAGILNEMAEAAAKEKIHLLVENEVACNVSTCAELAALLKMVPSKWVGINWDPLNGTAFDEPPFPKGYALLPKKRIGNVQVKGRSILDFPQKLDWPAMLAALDKDGYRGHVGLETHIFGDKLIHYSHESMKEILRIVSAS